MLLGFNKKILLAINLVASTSTKYSRIKLLHYLSWLCKTTPYGALEIKKQKNG